MAITILRNISADLFDITTIHLALNKLQSKRNADGTYSWTKPDINNWEKYVSYIPKYTIISSTSEDLIPESMKFNRPGYIYFTHRNVTGGDRVVILYPGTLSLGYSHFGTENLLDKILIECLKDCGVPESAISTNNNDILLNGKKIIGLVVGKRAGFVHEFCVLTFEYNDSLFKEILPPDYYYFQGSTETGITGILNEFPDIDRQVFSAKIANYVANNPTTYVEYPDLGFNGLFNVPDPDNIEEQRTILFNQLKDDSKRQILSFYDNLVDLSIKKEQIKDYRDRIELGMTPLITQTQYVDYMYEVEAAREYVNSLFSRVDSVQTKDELDSIACSNEQLQSFIETFINANKTS